VEGLAIAMVTSAFSVTPAAEAAGRDRCEGGHFTPADTLSALPAEVDALLRWPGPINERGNAFHVGVMPGPREPWRRFGVAAVGQHRAFASVERGGGAEGDEVWSFDLVEGHWTGGQRSVSLASDRSVSDLLRAACIDGDAAIAG
jgi:hypothetical protein